MTEELANMSKQEIVRHRQNSTACLFTLRSKLRPVLNRAWLLVATAALCACARADKADEPRTYIGSNLTSMDYEPTDTFVRPVYVNGKGGDMAGDGASTMLGVLSLPARWYPGLTARVKWRRCNRNLDYVPGEPKDKGCRWVEKDVPVQPYSYVAETWLHIFEKDEVLVIPSALFPSDRDYPGAGYPYKNFIKKRGIGEHEQAGDRQTPPVFNRFPAHPAKPIPASADSNVAVGGGRGAVRMRACRQGGRATGVHRQQSDFDGLRAD